LTDIACKLRRERKTSHKSMAVDVVVVDDSYLDDEMDLVALCDHVPP